MNSLLAGLTQEDNTVADIALSTGEAIQLGADTANLEHEAETIIRDFDNAETAETQINALVAIAEATSEDDKSTIADAYAIAAGAIASKLGVPVEVIGTDVTVEGAVDTAKNVIVALAQVAHTFIVKLTATAKKLFLKAMAWIVSSDKKRDELVKKLEENKDYTLTADELKTLAPVLQTRAAYYKGAIEGNIAGALGKELAKQLKDALKDTTGAKPKIAKNDFAKKLIESNLFTGSLDDKVKKILAASDVSVNILATAGKKVTFIIAGTVGEGDKASAETKVVVRELAEVKDEDVIKASKITAVDHIVGKVKGLSTAKELQTKINENFDAMATASDIMATLKKDAGEWAEKKEMAATVKSGAITLSKTAFAQSKDLIAEYRFGMNLGKLGLNFKEKK